MLAQASAPAAELEETVITESSNRYRALPERPHSLQEDHGSMPSTARSEPLGTSLGDVEAQTPTWEAYNSGDEAVQQSRLGQSEPDLRHLCSDAPTAQPQHCRGVEAAADSLDVHRAGSSKGAVSAVESPQAGDVEHGFASVTDGQEPGDMESLHREVHLQLCTSPLGTVTATLTVVQHEFDNLKPDVDLPSKAPAEVQEAPSSSTAHLQHQPVLEEDAQNSMESEIGRQLRATDSLTQYIDCEGEVSEGDSAEDQETELPSYDSAAPVESPPDSLPAEHESETQLLAGMSAPTDTAEQLWLPQAKEQPLSSPDAACMEDEQGGASSAVDFPDCKQSAVNGPTMDEQGSLAEEAVDGNPLPPESGNPGMHAKPSQSHR